MEEQINNLQSVKVEQIPPTNAYPKFDGTQYVVEPEVTGTAVDMDMLHEKIAQYIREFKSELNMEEEGDALDILARRYLDMHCAVMSPNPHRYSILKDLARDFAVDAVVDLTWQGCQPYDVESWSVKKFVREELGLPFLQVVTDYSGTDTEQLKVRLEAFLEMLA